MMETKEWITVPSMVSFKFNEDSQDYTLTWQDEKVIMRIEANACKVENNVLSVQTLTKPTIVKMDADIESTEKDNIKYPECKGNTYCSGNGPNQWGLTICCSTGYIVGVCYGNWKCTG